MASLVLVLGQRKVERGGVPIFKAACDIGVERGEGRCPVGNDCLSSIYVIWCRKALEVEQACVDD